MSGFSILMNAIRPYATYGMHVISTPSIYKPHFMDELPQVGKYDTCLILDYFDKIQGKNQDSSAFTAK